MKERFEKLGELWGNLPGSKKATLAFAALGIVGLSIAILSFSGGSTQMRVLVSGADSKDLGEVVEILKTNQIPYEYNEAGDSILVPEDKRGSMRMELAMKRTSASRRRQRQHIQLQR